MQLSKLNLLDALRFIALITVGLFLNLAIFILIQQLVRNENGLNTELTTINLVEFIRFEHKSKPPDPKIESIEPPPIDQEEPPPPPQIIKPKITKPQTAPVEIPLPVMDIPLSLSGAPYLGDVVNNALSGSFNLPTKPDIDTNIEPTLQIDPIYPIRALRQGIEGVVTVEFAIATDGSVKNIIIVEATPAKIFDASVLKAIAKWRFNPKIVDGQRVEQHTRQNIEFKLER